MVEAQLLAAWLTPTSFFVLLNIVLATIFLNHKNNKNNPRENAAVSSTASHPQLNRAPSLFSRVASFNFSHYAYSDDSHVSHHPDPSPSVNQPSAAETIVRAPSLLYRVASFKFGWTAPPDSEGKKVNQEDREEVASAGHVRRENEEKIEEVKVKKKVVKKKVKKEAVKGEVKTTAFRREDEEVDSKADDFINKFKQQLKLQRLESLLRYRNVDATPA